VTDAGRPSVRRQPTSVLVAAALAGVLSAAGCAGDSSDEREASPTSSAEATGAADLAEGLLPAEAFGPDATVVPITPEQLQRGAGLAPGTTDLQITPPECAPAVQGTQPDLDAFDDIAAQSATVGTSTTVEVLLRGGPTGGSLDQIDRAVETCPRARITSPQFGTADITFEAVPVDEHGDGAAALRFTTVVPQPDGTQVTVPALVGVVQDGDRLVMLLNLSPDGTPPDPEAFTDLLEQAYEAQAEGLD
jgi:hypothetical protein